MFVIIMAIIMALLLMWLRKMLQSQTDIIWLLFLVIQKIVSNETFAWFQGKYSKK